MINEEKAVIFVKHIEKHLKEYKDRGLLLKQYDVMCKFCLKTIDEIYNEYMEEENKRV